MFLQSEECDYHGYMIFFFLNFHIFKTRLPLSTFILHFSLRLQSNETSGSIIGIPDCLSECWFLLEGSDPLG
jgi:hypothetical protein